MPTHTFLNHHRRSNFHHHHRHYDDPPIQSPPPPKPNQKILSLFLKSIIMGLIISVFLLFIGVAAIAFLHILILGSFLHRRRRISTSPSSTTSSSSSPSPGAYSVDQLQKYLPPFVYTTSSMTASKECSICLEYFREGEFCRTLPACSHVFHASCVNQWLTRVPNCPVCRSRVQLNMSASDSIISDEDFKLLWSIGV